MIFHDARGLQIADALLARGWGSRYRCWSCDQQRLYIKPEAIGIFGSTEILNSTKKKLIISLIGWIAFYVFMSIGGLPLVNCLLSTSTRGLSTTSL